MEAGLSYLKFRLPILEMGPRWAPTRRGLILFLFGLWLLLGPAAQSQDIVAASLAATFFALVLPLALTSILHGSSLRKKLRIQLGAAALNANGENRISSKRPFKFSVLAGPLGLLPIFKLKIEPEFERSGAPKVTFILSGRSDASRTASAAAALAHRGIWAIKRVKISLEDVFGLSRYSFNAPGPTAPIEVLPPRIPTPDLPVLASCTREGDLLSDVRERSGDPLDLKPYHPSDGLKRILWKVYAKSGELVARHPERSVSPEGRVALYVLADKHDDAAAGAATSYARALSDLGLDLLAGVEGGGARPPAESADNLERALVDCVWRSGEAPKQTAESADKFVTALQEKLGASHADSIIVTASGRRAAQDKESLKEVGEAFLARGLRPIFVLFSERGGISHSKDQPPILAFAARLFLTGSSDTNFEDGVSHNGFLLLCRSLGWEVIVVDI